MVKYDPVTNPKGLVCRALSWKFQKPARVGRWKRKRRAFYETHIRGNPQWSRHLIAEDEFSFDYKKPVNRHNARVWVHHDEDVPALVRRQYPHRVMFAIAILKESKLPIMPLAVVRPPKRGNGPDVVEKMTGSAKNHKKFVFNKIRRWIRDRKRRCKDERDFRLLTDNCAGHEKLRKDGYFSDGGAGASLHHIGFGGYANPDGGYPPNSPDFNPCEYAINALKERMSRTLIGKELQGETIDKKAIIDAAKKEWANLPVRIVTEAWNKVDRNLEQSYAVSGDIGADVEAALLNKNTRQERQ